MARTKDLELAQARRRSEARKARRKLQLKLKGSKKAGMEHWEFTTNLWNSLEVSQNARPKTKFECMLVEETDGRRAGSTTKNRKGSHIDHTDGDDDDFKDDHDGSCVWVLLKLCDFVWVLSWSEKLMCSVFHPINICLLLQISQTPTRQTCRNHHRHRSKMANRMMTWPYSRRSNSF